MKGCQVLPPWKQRYLHCLFFVFKISSHAEGEGGSLSHPEGMILEERRILKILEILEILKILEESAKHWPFLHLQSSTLSCPGQRCGHSMRRKTRQGKFLFARQIQGNNKEEKRRKIVLSRGNCKRGATHVKAGHRALQRTFWMRSLSDDNACLTIS